MIRYAVATIALGLLIGWYIHSSVDGARLEPDRREILIREVDNGYVILYRTTNNPYPVREAVSADVAGVTFHVKGYLGMPIPATRWGH